MSFFREPSPPNLEQEQFSAFLNDTRHSGRMAQEHWHNFYELLYLFEGNTVQTVNHLDISMTAGDTLLIAPGDLHSTTACCTCLIGVVQFSQQEKLPSLLLANPQGTKLAQLFSQINEEATLRPTGCTRMIRGLILQVLALL